MKNILVSSLLTVLASTGIAHAGVSNQVSLGYQNNKVNDTEGVVLDVATHLPNNLLVGLNTQFDGATLNTYGAYLGVPYVFVNTPLSLTPTIGVDHYREEGASVGNVGIKAGYLIDRNTTINAQAKYSKAFSSKDDLEGGSYTVGITRHF